MLGRFLRVSLLVFLGLSRVPVSPYIHNNAISVRTMRQGIYISHAIYISGAGQGVVRLRFHAGVRPRVCVFRRRAYLLFPNVRRYVSLLLTFSPCPESRHFPSPHPRRDVCLEFPKNVCPTISPGCSFTFSIILDRICIYALDDMISVYAAVVRLNSRTGISPEIFERKREKKYVLAS